jgi:hypothetical protein
MRRWHGTAATLSGFLILVSGLSAQESKEVDRAIDALKKAGGNFVAAPGNAAAMVNFNFSAVKDKDLAHLKPLTKMQSLYLNDTKITDKGLANVKGLTQLIYLNLDNTKITDAGLRNLKGLKKLKTLGLTNTPITDAGLRQLKGLSELKQIFIMRTKVTDRGVAELQKALPKLKINR